MALLDAFRAQVEAHTRFFDHLVELVPAKHYLELEPPANLQYMKKGVRAAEKERLKKLGKQRKRARLETEEPTALDLQREQAAAPVAGSGLHLSAGTAPSIDDLRERLHKRLEAMRQGRHAEEPAAAGPAAGAGKASQAQAAREWRRQAASKRKRPDPGEQAAAPAAVAQGAEKPKAAPVAAGEAADLRFSRVDLGADASKKGRRKKASKAELLEAAQQKQEHRKALEGTVEGRVLAEEEGWKAAMARAGGQRILDDPKRLSRSLKKEAKLKAKKAQAWGERQAHQRKEQQAKQAKRTENLGARAQAKLARHKDKREKKLMRAGFEGRRDTFINA